MTDSDKSASQPSDGDDAFCDDAFAGFRVSSVCVMEQGQAKHCRVRFEFAEAGAVRIDVSTPGAEICLFDFVLNVF